MADISILQLPNGNEYNLKDTTARDAGIFYGTCGTGGGTAAKVATVNGVTELKEGLTIAIKFTAANTIANPTLNVNSLGAKAIKRYGTTAPSTSAASSWNANSVVTLTYDGTYWMLHDWNNTTYSSMSVAEYEAGTGTTARVITPARLKAAILEWAETLDLSISSDGDLDGATYTITDGSDTYSFPSSNRLNVFGQVLNEHLNTLAVNGNAFPSESHGNLYNLELDADDIPYSASQSVYDKINDIVTTGGEPNVIESISVNGTAQTITNKNVDIDTVLTGTTSQYTPTQVLQVLQNGQNVQITYAHQTYGNIVASSFNYSQGFGAIIANVIGYYMGVGYMLFELVGILSDDHWECFVTTLAEQTDIPTNVSDLTNDAGYITAETDPVFSASAASGITSTNISTWNGKYSKPSGGIPETDLASAVQTSLGKADTALQSYTETDPTVPSWAKQSTKPTYTASEVGALANTGGEVTGDIILSTASGDSPAIIFKRGTYTDNYNDWRIVDSGGYLYFAQRGQNSSSFANQVYFNTTGGVVATTFNGSGANLTGVLKPADITSSITSSSTNSQAAGAKAVYDIIGDIETLLAAL